MSAVKQPAFTRVINNEGAIISFDRYGKPLHGITTRAYDPLLKKDIPIRNLTRSELDEPSELLLQHFRKEFQQGIYTIVIHCSDIRKAANEVIGTKRPDINYYMKASLTTGLCQIFRESGGTIELIASEKIYYRNP